MAVPASRRTRGTTIKDLGGRDPKAVKRQETLEAVGAQVDPRRLTARVSAMAKQGRRSLAALRRVPLGHMVPLPFLGAGLLLLHQGRSTWALVALLAGFGHALLTLLAMALPRVTNWVRSRPAPLRLPLWVVGWVGCASLGLFSTALLAVVLTIGGFTTARVLRSFVLRLVKWLSHQPAAGVVQAQVDYRPMIGAACLVAAASVTIGLLLPSLRLEGEVTFVLAALNFGLAVGLVRTDWQLLRDLHSPPTERWRSRWTRGLVRDVLLAAVLSALAGHEVYIAVRGSSGGLAASSTILLVLSYLFICVRQLPRWGGLLGSPRPQLLLSSGLLLAHAPFLVLLAAPSSTLPYVYGGAEAAGLLLGLASFLYTPARMQRLPPRLRRLLGA